MTDVNYSSNATRVSIPKGMVYLSLRSSDGEVGLSGGSDRRSLRITQLPQDVTVTAHNSSGPVGAGTTARVNDPWSSNYQVSPRGSDSNAPLQVNAPGGRVTQPTPGKVVYTPTQPGVNTVDRWGDITTSVTVNASGGGAQTTQPKAKGSKKRGARDE